MYCWNCGAPVRPNSTQCSTCGAAIQGSPLAPAPARPRRDDYDDEPSVEVESNLVKAILVTLFCCLPFGVVAIIHASQVSGFVAAGKIKAARRAAKKADDWANYALIGGLLYVIFVFLLLILESL